VQKKQNGTQYKSYERQGIDKLPGVHLRAAASQMERKGIATDRGNINREVADINKEIRQAKARKISQAEWEKRRRIL